MALKCVITISQVKCIVAGRFYYEKSKVKDNMIVAIYTSSEILHYTKLAM